MSHKTIITIDGESRQLITYSTNYFRTKPKMKNLPSMQTDSSRLFEPIAADLRAGCSYDDRYYYSQPYPQAFGGLFYISFEASDDDDLFYYWLKSCEMMNGSIEFYNTLDEDDIPFQRIEFWDAFLVSIKEQTTQGAYPMIMECDISAAIVRHNRDNATLHRKSWYVTDIDKKDNPCGTGSIENKIQITDIYWLDAHKKRRYDIFPDNPINLLIDVENYNEGDKLDLIVKHSGGKKIARDKTEFIISGKIEPNGIVKIKQFKINYNEINKLGKVGFYSTDREEIDHSLSEKMGWFYIKNSTQTIVCVNIELNLDLLNIATGYTRTDCEIAINEQFKRVFEISSKNKMSGMVLFEGKSTEDEPQIIPLVTLLGKTNSLEFAGSAIKSSISVNVFNSKGELYSLKDLSLNIVHELLHTLRLTHPFEITICSDTKLLKDGKNNYKTVEGTDPNIYFNIMNYGRISINGRILNELWKEKDAEYLTNGQLNFIIKEIDLQKKGYGTYGEIEKYEPYWGYYIFEGNYVK